MQYISTRLCVRLTIQCLLHRKINNHNKEISCVFLCHIAAFVGEAYLFIHLFILNIFSPHFGATVAAGRAGLFEVPLPLRAQPDAGASFIHQPLRQRPIRAQELPAGSKVSV